MSQALRVLLISPLPTRDPNNGDVTYTEQLLAHPPEGIEYVTYEDALREGSLVELFRRDAHESVPRALMRHTDRLGFVREATVNKARRQGLIFREPFRHFDLHRSAFDLVHTHVYSVRLRPQGVPLVVSNSVPLHARYVDGLRQGRAKVRVLRRLDTWLAARTGVTHAAYEHRGAALVICFSNYLREWFVSAGGDPDRYVVVPPGICSTKIQPRSVPGQAFTLGFIGDWDSKGGDTVLAAHRLLRQRGLDVRLVVVGSEARIDGMEMAQLNVTWLPRLPRERLLREVVPALSVFAYPSRFDGLPLTLLEVMGAGVPVIVSDYGALPEIVNYGQAGIVVARNRAELVAEQVERLVDSSLRERFGQAARARVVSRYDIGHTAAALGHAYRTAHQHENAL
jgi:glycosyltransferase involved in cell wall biosynthesis